MKDLSVIIINYNVKVLITECIRSIYKYTEGIDYEIIVLDNCSTEKGIEQLVYEFPEVQLIKNNENVGFAKANNQGTAVATGRNLLFLNPDTILFNNALTTLVSFIDSHKDAGIVGPKLYKNINKEYYPLLDKFTSPLEIFIWHLPLHRLFSKIHYTYFYNCKIIRPVDWVCGAALLIKRDVWDELIGFDEKFFMYSEEQDLCLRAKQKGYQVYYNPEAEIVHLGGHSANQMNKKSHHYYWESKIYFFQKHYTTIQIKWFKKYFSWLIRVKLMLKINPSYNKKVLEVLQRHKDFNQE